jgi:Family of unknown function (DUF5709)
VSDDPQDVAESLDEDVIEIDDDLTGDDYGEDLPDYPPDRPLGVGTVGITAVEEDAGESFAERTLREVPERWRSRDVADVGQLVEPDASTEDDEEQEYAQEEPGLDLSPEEAAMHIDPDS